MNRSPIEWCDWTWNPISGCRHACRNQYCYVTLKPSSPLNRFGARFYDAAGKLHAERDWRSRETGQCHVAKRGEVYPYGYDCTYYPHRLDEPRSVKTASRVFCVDVGDLFGHWVPVTWIRDILDTTQKYDWHKYLFLTKNPARLAGFEFHENNWVGTTITSGKDEKRAELIKDVKAPVRYLSVEPLMGPIGISMKGIQWVIIGAQTGPNPTIPQKSWAVDVIAKCARRRIPVFIKSNLSKIYPDLALQQYP